MNKHNFISLLALLAFVIILPVYAMMEPGRMLRAKMELRQEYMEDGSRVYLRYCAACHGVEGEGLGVMPPLNHPALVEADESADEPAAEGPDHASPSAGSGQVLVLRGQELGLEAGPK